MREGHKPLGVIRDAQRLGIDTVAVGVSCGIDSVATLDLCVSHFANVRPYFMYVVPGISFQERYLAYLERRFKVKIERVPHWMLARVLSDGVLRFKTIASASIRKCRPAHFLAWIRQRLDCQWVATGEKAADSLERNTQLVQGGGVQAARLRLYPLAWWSTADVQSYLASKRVMLPPDYRLNATLPESLRNSRGSSFGGLINMREILPIAENFPEDYARIRKMFPLIDGQLVRWKMLNERGIVTNEKRSEVCRSVTARRKAEKSMPVSQSQEASNGQENHESHEAE